MPSCPDEEEIWIVDLITLAGFASTNGEARRFIGAAPCGSAGEVIERREALASSPGRIEVQVLQVGKRRYARLVSAT